MNNTPIRICDIYTGKPDAKDEILYSGDQFIDSFVLPPQFDPADICKRNRYFIVGDKGSGKTALLRYLDHYFRDQDQSACTSFILFKSNYNELERTKIERTGKRIVNAISPDSNSEETSNREILAQSSDYTDLWLWHLFRRIIEDNETCNRNLFEDNEDWRQFEKVISSVLKKEKKRSIFSGFTLSLDPSPMFPELATIPAITLNINNEKGDQEQQYLAFPEYIDLACRCFAKTIRTDTPYYIFVDELEAYFGQKSLFIRDLELVRDLLFAVKKVNDLLIRLHTSSRVFCSVRQEILNSILYNDSIVPKELNRVITGFAFRLQWYGKTTEIFDLPILQVLLRRIEMTEQEAGIHRKDRQELIDHWFPATNGNNKSLVLFFLNNSWHKPRDVVRLLTDMSNCTDTCFTLQNLQASLEEYSPDSLDELQEELRAIYDTAQVDGILRVLRGAPDKFTAEELEERAKDLAPDCPLSTDIRQSLSTLYRQGFVGNITFNPTRYRLQCRGANHPIFSDDWLFFVHSGLQKTLSIVPRKRDDLPSALFDANDDSDLEDTAQRFVGQESVLSDMERSNTSIRGVMEVDGRSLVGTLSKNYLASLGLAEYRIEAFQGLTAPVKLLTPNPNSENSYNVQLLDPEPFVAAVKEMTQQLTKPPEPGTVYSLSHLSLTAKGHVKGRFQCNLVGILSTMELRSKGIDPHQLVATRQTISARLQRSQVFPDGTTVYYMVLEDPSAVRTLNTGSDPAF